ncbi:MAG: hypothetical protein K0S68_6 [Candidatus Saccharibacteria bacterium]|jgi:hypothetical protein|nr:hypothetical protein [Candidatus Saccharibacteria bacterium]
MRRIALILSSLVIVMMQISLLPALKPLGVVPNIALAWVVLVGLEGTASSALAVAVASGIIIDLASGANFGLWTGTLVLAALAGGVVHRAGIELTGWLVAGVMVAVGTLLMTIITLGGLVDTVGEWPAGAMVGRFMTELMLNLLLTAGLRRAARMVAAGPRTSEATIG